MAKCYGGYFKDELREPFEYWQEGKGEACQERMLELEQHIDNLEIVIAQQKKENKLMQDDLRKVYAGHNGGWAIKKEENALDKFDLVKKLNA